MKQYLTISFCLLGIISFGQDTIYLDKDLKKGTPIEYYQIVKHNQSDTNRATETTYFKSGQIKSETRFSNYTKGEVDGNCKEYYKNGQIKEDTEYKFGKMNGLNLTYWKNGTPKRIDTYENDKLIKGQCFNSQGMDTLYFAYEIMAEFPGGTNGLFEYIAKELKYPHQSRDNGIQGKVLIGFMVNENGSVSDVTIEQSVNDEIDAEAIRIVLKMPKWGPAMLDGEACKIKFTMPINFVLR